MANLSEPLNIDLSAANAATLVTQGNREVRFALIGCGGTGSWLAPSIARIMRVANEARRAVSAVFMDPDVVEAKNIGRQNFCDAEIGLNKAVTLATRFNLSWGLDITALPTRLNGDSRFLAPDALNIVIGCVDNPAARRRMNEMLKLNKPGAPPTHWWLDCGNGKSSGQVLLGSAYDTKALRGAFPAPELCQALPSPSMVAPDLLEVQPSTKTSKMSCADLQIANLQGLMINQRIAAEAAEFLYRMTVAGELKRFATYLDQTMGSQRSLYITPETIARSLNRPVERLKLAGGTKR